jgi:hypothetical protein
VVAEYARLLGVDIPERKRSVLSLITHLGDKRYLMLLTFSRFGAHFPDDRLHESVTHSHTRSWKDGVAQAVAGYAQERDGCRAKR